MSTWKAVLAVLAIFILGTVFGLAVSFWITPNTSAFAQPVREILTKRLNQRLAGNLSLTPAQKEAIAGIVADARNQLVEIRKETRPRVRQVIAVARDRIRAQLTPEQQARFDEMMKRRRLLNRVLAP